MLDFVSSQATYTVTFLCKNLSSLFYFGSAHTCCDPRGVLNPSTLPASLDALTLAGESSIVVSMELNGVGYQGVLFAQPRSARV